MRAINLLPKDAERARRTTPDPALLTGVIGFAVVFLALGWMFLSANRSVQDKQSQHDNLAIQVAKNQKLNPLPTFLPAQEAISPLQAPRVSAATSALGYRIPWDNILSQLVKALPAGVKLTTLNATSPISPNTALAATTGVSGTSATPNLTLSGWAYGQDSIALLMTRLMLMPSLVKSSVMLTNTIVNPSAGATSRSFYTFSISAQIRAPGAIS